MKNKINLLLLMLTMPVFMSAQFVQAFTEEVENNNTLNAKTYRIYIQLTNKNDQIFMIYGDKENPMEISSTKPFYQSPYGGGMARDVNRKMASDNDSLRYDSWITIGAADNYDNNLSQLNLDLKEFEEKGGAIKTTDGAWFCVPTDQQVFCKEDKRMLIMQLTTAGEINARFNIMGRTAAGENFQVKDIVVSAGKKKK